MRRPERHSRGPVASRPAFPARDSARRQRLAKPRSRLHSGQQSRAPSGGRQTGARPKAQAPDTRRGAAERSHATQRSRLASAVSLINVEHHWSGARCHRDSRRERYNLNDTATVPARVFTDGEIAYCLRRREPAIHFAGRFAAKEAAMKALGTGHTQQVLWRDVEVVRRGDRRNCSFTAAPPGGSRRSARDPRCSPSPTPTRWHWPKCSCSRVSNAGWHSPVVVPASDRVPP